MTSAPHDNPGRSKLPGVLKLIGVLALTLLALVAMLVAFDVLPRSVLGELATKILLAACVLAIASAGIALLTRGKS